MEKTIREISDATGLSRITLQQSAKRGAFPARQAGKIWMIDILSSEFKAWLEDHHNQPRVVGALKKLQKGENHETSSY